MDWFSIRITFINTSRSFIQYILSYGKPKTFFGNLYSDWNCKEYLIARLPGHCSISSLPLDNHSGYTNCPLIAHPRVSNPVYRYDPGIKDLWARLYTPVSDVNYTRAKTITSPCVGTASSKVLLPRTQLVRGIREETQKKIQHNTQESSDFSPWVDFNVFSERKVGWV